MKPPDAQATELLDKRTAAAIEEIERQLILLRVLLNKEATDDNA